MNSPSPRRPECYLCGERLTESYVTRLFHNQGAFLFCSEHHANRWDTTMEATSIRLNEAVGDLGRFGARMMTPVANQMARGVEAIGRWARGK